MMLRFNDRTIGGFCLVQDGPYFHLYYSQTLHPGFQRGLQSRRNSIGHAVSEDLNNWEILPDALKPSEEEEAWDNEVINPGSIIKREGLWYFFYSGASTWEEGLVQRIGLAFSEDLINWQKNKDNPVIEADRRWYAASGDVRWGDPWIFNYEGSFHAYLAARYRDENDSMRGAIARARSVDLLHWEALKPVAHPKTQGKIRSPQLEHVGGRWLLFYSIEHDSLADLSAEILESDAGIGLYYQVGDSALGPFDTRTEQRLMSNRENDSGSCRAIRGPGGTWVILCLGRGKGAGGANFSNPIPLVMGVDGSLGTQ